MASSGESSSPSLKNDKPVIVRVKRKSSQSCLDAFWLEINERPLKRALLDFDKFSISDSSSKVEELKNRKVMVQHVETVTTSEVTLDILQSFVSNSPDELKSRGQNAEIRRTFKTENKQDQLLVKAKQKQEVLSKNARFEQIWRSRREKKEFVHDEARDICRLYDVVRVDVEEKSNDVQKDEFPELDDDCKMMCEYLPLLREVLPSAAAEVEADILDRMSGRASLDNYVYDYYTIKDDMDITEENAACPFPLVQVQDDDDDYYDGPDDSEYETDNSNAENNPLNDYPDEESSDIEDLGSSCADKNTETESRSGDSVEKDESASEKSFEPEEFGDQDWSDNPDFLYEDEIYGGDDDGKIGNDDFGEDWR